MSIYFTSFIPSLYYTLSTTDSLCRLQYNIIHIDSLVQRKCNFSALTMEWRHSCTNPSIYSFHYTCRLLQYDYRNFSSQLTWYMFICVFVFYACLCRNCNVCICIHHYSLIGIYLRDDGTYKWFISTRTGMKNRCCKCHIYIYIYIYIYIRWLQ